MLTPFAALPLLLAGDGSTTLLADINQLDPPTIPASHPQDLASIGGRVYFSAHGDGGREPWVSDGTTAGTERLADVFVGFSSSSPADFTGLASGLVVFSAVSLDAGRELWVTDGTAAGTEPLADLNPGPQSSDPTALTLFDGRIWFVADDGGHGRELWSTDGTTAGTRFEVSVHSGSAGLENGPGGVQLEVSGGLLFFSGLDVSSPGWALYQTDGTTTVPLARITVDDAQPITQMEGGTGMLVLRAPTGFIDESIWRSDGTPAGTYEIVSGSTVLGFDYELVTVGSDVYFAADVGGVGRELWKTDGTSAGTQLVADLQPNGGLITGASPRPIANLNGELIFSATTLADGHELWTTDGTPEGTYLIDAVPGTGSLQPGQGVVSGGQLVFVAVDPALGAELFVSDGTLAGTGPLADIAPGPLTSFPNQLVDLNGTVILAANDSLLGAELWSATTAGASLVADISPVLFNQDSEPREITAVGQRAFFSANDGVYGRELWVTDGSAAGTAMAVDLLPGENGSGPVSLTAFGDKLFFLANDGVHGVEPWISDGTLAGTVLLADIAPGSADSNWGPVATIFFDGKLFFSATGGEGDGVWSTDGTPAGTTELDVPGIDLLAFFVTTFAEFDGALYFVGFESASGAELYRTDGTSAGTAQVIDLNPGASSGVEFSPLVELGGSLYFTGDDGFSGSELWRTDGTVLGTELVEDLAPGTDGSFPAELTRVGQRLVFTRFNPDWSKSVFATDGNTPAVELATLPSGVSGPLFSDGQTAFFWGPTPVNPQLWSSDGTVAGTEVILDVAPAQGFLGTPAFGAAGTGPVSVLAAGDGNSGFELFRSDGSAPGTFLVADVEPGAATSRPGNFARLGNRLLFAAERFETGRELHLVPLADVGDFVLASFGNACVGSSGLAPVWTSAGPAEEGVPLSLQLADASPLSPGLILVGFTSFANPIGACTLDVFASSIDPFATDGAGSFTVGVTPGPALVGVELFLEALVVDPGGSFLGLASKTRGLELIVAP